MGRTPRRGSSTLAGPPEVTGASSSGGRTAPVRGRPRRSKSEQRRDGRRSPPRATPGLGDTGAPHGTARTASGSARAERLALRRGRPATRTLGTDHPVPPPVEGRHARSSIPAPASSGVTLGHTPRVHVSELQSTTSVRSPDAPDSCRHDLRLRRRGAAGQRAQHEGRSEWTAFIHTADHGAWSCGSRVARDREGRTIRAGQPVARSFRSGQQAPKRRARRDQRLRFGCP